MQRVVSLIFQYICSTILNITSILDENATKFAIFDIPLCMYCVWIINSLRAYKFIGIFSVIFFWFKIRPKELSLWDKIKYLNFNIFGTWCCKPLIFQTQIIWSNRIHSLKYLRSATFVSKDIVIRKSEYVAKTQFL